ncbi:MAG: TatD family deoxyribonuclease [Acidobacteria bacterium]|nr:TatD family deoxyribonuclease [Acidobacteriota bacterium]
MSEREGATALHGIVDTHAHMCDAAFQDDRAETLRRAREAGVDAVVAVGENLEDARRNLELAAAFPMLRPAAGLYPTRLDLDHSEVMIGFIREHRQELSAIGEVGLDYWAVQDEAERDRQREIFRRFIRLSLELDLPLNVHSRSAGRHTVEMLIREGARKVQLHAFDGKAASAMPAVDAGYFFSIPPSVVRSQQKQKLVKRLPLSCLLVETDSPVLGPDGGLRNEPANAIVSLHAIAQIRGIDPGWVAEAVRDNTARLYGRHLPPSD